MSSSGPQPPPPADLLSDPTPVPSGPPSAGGRTPPNVSPLHPRSTGGGSSTPSPDRTGVAARATAGLRSLRGRKAPSADKSQAPVPPPPAPPPQAGGSVAVAEGTRKHLVSYTLLAKTLRDLAGSADQKKQQQQLVGVVFPKLAVYNSVDPSLATPLLTLLQTASDAVVLRYAYYFVGRILSESGAHGAFNEGGGVPIPPSISDELGAGREFGERLAEGVSLILKRLIIEAATPEVAVHVRRMAALKSLVCVPMSNDEAFASVVQIIFDMLDSIGEDRKKRRRWSRLLRRGVTNKDAHLRANIFYGALSALRRVPMDPTNETLIERVILGIGCPDPVGLRHALSMAVDLALENPVAVATLLATLAGGSIAQAIRSTDMYARVYLARLCGSLIHSPAIYERSDLRGLFSAVLFQLLYDQEVKVCLEAISCIVACFSAKVDSNTDQRADGWQILTTSLMDTRGAAKEVGLQKAKETMPTPPSYDLVLKVVVFRLELALRSTSRPMLHAAVRTVVEIGKARAAAFAIGLFTEVPDQPEQQPAAEVDDFQQAMGKAPKETPAKEKVKVDTLLGVVMESVRCVAVCECVYVRAQALKAMIWMQSEYENADELKSTLAGELMDPDWPAAILNDLLVTLHARFKATPSMAVMILDLASLFVNLVPAKLDTNVLQALWKTCLIKCGPEGKQLSLEAVSAVLDLPPPPPAAVSLQQQKVAAVVSTSDPASALALRRIVQSAIWFLGENANYAAGEYAWESATPPGAALMLLDAERMVAAAGVRNPTLAAAMARLQRVAIINAWEERVVAAHALMTIAIRSGEPYRLQIYEFFHALLYGGGSSRKVRGMALGTPNGETRGASGTGLGVVIGSMLKVLDEMYRAQDQMMTDVRAHEFSKEEWKEEELARIYDTHEHLIDLALLFCFVPRSKYLPLGPLSKRLIYQYRMMNNIEDGRNDVRLKESLRKIMSYTGGLSKDTQDFPPITLLEPVSDFSPSTLAEGVEFPGTTAVVEEDVPATPRRFEGLATNFDQVYASSLLEAEDDAASELSDGDDSPTSRSATSFANNMRSWDEESIPGRRDDAEASESEGPGGVSAVDFDEEYESEIRERASAAAAQGDLQIARALYKFMGGDEDELSLEVGDLVEIEYEADGWYHVRRKTAGADGKLSGFVPVLYLNVQS